MRDISVIICTQNRASFLKDCLQSLCAQDLDPARYEICVVNNAGTDNTPEVVAHAAEAHPRHKIYLVDEPVPGLSRARNCGMRASEGTFVAYTDDDATVPSDWLNRILGRFVQGGPSTVLVGGEVEPVWGAPKPDWITPRLRGYLTAGTGLGDIARFLEGSECCCECNSTYRRTALIAAGGFPEELGRVGACLLSGENVIESLMRKQGGRVFYDPSIVVKHFIHADRLVPGWLRRRFFWQGISGYAVRQYQLRNGVPVDAQAFLNLPLSKEDWDFLSKDNAENLEDSYFKFQSLGFVLALTGLMPVEGVS